MYRNRFQRRPWLRYLEGTEGAQAGGDGTPGVGDPTPQGGEPQGSQQQAGDRGSQDDDTSAGADEPEEGVEKSTEPTPEPTVSEPTPKVGEKADTTGRDAELAELKAQVELLTKAHEAQKAEQRTALTVDVAKEVGLPESLARRLEGETREQLLADARALAKDLSIRVTDPTQGKSGGAVATTIEDAIKAHYGIN